MRNEEYGDTDRAFDSYKLGRPLGEKVTWLSQNATRTTS